MYKYIPINKKTKKEQKEFYSLGRKTWDGLRPVTKSMPNGKAYDRHKMKQIKYEEY